MHATKQILSLSSLLLQRQNKSYQFHRVHSAAFNLSEAKKQLSQTAIPYSLPLLSIIIIPLISGNEGSSQIEWRVPTCVRWLHACLKLAATKGSICTIQEREKFANGKTTLQLCVEATDKSNKNNFFEILRQKKTGKVGCCCELKIYQYLPKSSINTECQPFQRILIKIFHVSRLLKNAIEIIGIKTTRMVSENSIKRNFQTGQFEPTQALIDVHARIHIPQVEETLLLQSTNNLCSICTTHSCTSGHHCFN